MTKTRHDERKFKLNFELKIDCKQCSSKIVKLFHYMPLHALWLFENGNKDRRYGHI